MLIFIATSILLLRGVTSTFSSDHCKEKVLYWPNHPLCPDASCPGDSNCKTNVSIPVDDYCITLECTTEEDVPEESSEETPQETSDTEFFKFDWEWWTDEGDDAEQIQHEYAEQHKEEDAEQHHEEDDAEQRHEEDKDAEQRHEEDDAEQHHQDKDAEQRHEEDDAEQHHEEDDAEQHHEEDDAERDNQQHKADAQHDMEQEEEQHAYREAELEEAELEEAEKNGEKRSQEKFSCSLSEQLIDNKRHYDIEENKMQKYYRHKMEIAAVVLLSAAGLYFLFIWVLVMALLRAFERQSYLEEEVPSESFIRKMRMKVFGTGEIIQSTAAEAKAALDVLDWEENNSNFLLNYNFGEKRRNEEQEMVSPKPGKMGKAGQGQETDRRNGCNSSHL